MDKKSLYIEVMELIGNLKNLLENQKDLPGKIPQIDLDLTIDKTRQLYDVLLKINNINNNFIQEPDLNKPDRSETVSDELDLEIENKPIDNIVAETLGQDKDIEVSSKVESNNKTTKELHNDVENEVTEASHYDLFSDSSDNDISVVDKIAEEQKKETVADKMEKDKITDLKMAIGINEKFFFINELFDGDMKKYKESVEKLDNCSSANETKLLVDQYAEENNWSPDSEGLILLLEFIERKFKE